MSSYRFLFLLVTSHSSLPLDISDHFLLDAGHGEFYIIGSWILLYSSECWVLFFDTGKLLHVGWTVSRLAFTICQSGSGTAFR